MMSTPGWRRRPQRSAARAVAHLTGRDAPSGGGRSAGSPGTAGRRRPRLSAGGRSPDTAHRTSCSSLDPLPRFRVVGTRFAVVQYRPALRTSSLGRAFGGFVVQSGRMSEHHLWAGSVPASGRHDLVVVDGRSFAISAEAGDMVGATHGLVYDDIRHLSRLRMTVNAGRVELLSSTTPTPLSAVTVSRALIT